MRTLVLVLFTAAPASASAQHPFAHFADAVDARFARSQPAVAYRLRVDPADTGRIAITMRIRYARDTIRLAMAAHPEYDDRYRRYVSELTAEAGGGPVPVVREDSAVWRVVAPGGDLTVRYAIRLPPREPFRGSWRPFLTPTGGLVGGPHSFMYVLGQTLAPSHVTFELPSGWAIATGLTPTGDPRTFFAPSVDVLVDSPALVGRLSVWPFAVDDVPHRVVYWRLPGAAAFDTLAFAGQIERVAREAVALFGRAPYRDFTFLMQDGAYGGLEHANSVTLGVASTALGANVGADLDEIAHEYLHTWNLVRIRPAEYGGVSHRPPPRVSGLWFSEGLTMYYADLLLRRAGLPAPESTRAGHVADRIRSYLASPGNGRLSAERVSRAEYSDDPRALGDYVASTHLQGELIGTVLDIMIQSATAGRRSMDDVMRLMLDRFSGARGFTGLDVERAVGAVCGCPASGFFAAHVRGGSPIDFDRYLALVGLRTRVTWGPAVGRDGAPVADTRIRPGDGAEDAPLVLHIFDPASAWGRAGVRGGDTLVALNGRPSPRWADLRTVVREARIGDSVTLDLRRGGAPVHATVVLTGYETPTVTLDTLPNVSPAVRALRARWLDGGRGNGVRKVTGGGTESR